MTNGKASTRASRSTGKAKQRRAKLSEQSAVIHYPNDSALASGARSLPQNAVRTPRARTLVLDAFRRGLSMQGAADDADMSRSSLYAWIREDTDFATEVEDAKNGGTDRMEEEGQRRGQRGVRKAVYHQGRIVGYERVYSDNLLIRSLEARRPESWKRNTSVDVNATVGGVIRHQHSHLHLTADDLKEIAAERGLPLEIFDK